MRTDQWKALGDLLPERHVGPDQVEGVVRWESPFESIETYEIEGWAAELAYGPDWDPFADFERMPYEEALRIVLGMGEENLLGWRMIEALR